MERAFKVSNSLQHTILAKVQDGASLQSEYQSTTYDTSRGAGWSEPSK